MSLQPRMSAHLVDMSKCATPLNGQSRQYQMLSEASAQRLVAIGIRLDKSPYPEIGFELAKDLGEMVRLSALARGRETGHEEP